MESKIKLFNRRQARLTRELTGPLEARTLVGLLLPSGLVLGGTWCVAAYSFGNNGAAVNSPVLSLGYTGDATAKNGMVLQAAVMRADGSAFSNVTLPGFGDTPSARMSSEAVVYGVVPTAGLGQVATEGGSVDIQNGVLTIGGNPSLGNTVNSITFSGSSTYRPGGTGAGTTTGTNAMYLAGIGANLSNGGAGTLTFTGDNIISPGVNVSGNSGSSRSLGSGQLIVNNGNLPSPTNRLLYGSGGGTLSLSGGVLELGSGNTASSGVTFSGRINLGTGYSFPQGSGTVSITGSTFSGAIPTWGGVIGNLPAGGTYSGSLSGVITAPPPLNNNSPPPNPHGVITFWEGTTALGTGSIDATTGVASLHLSTALQAGPHAITASYGGDGGAFAPAASAPSFLLVTQGQTTTNLAVSSPQVTNDAATVTLTATTITNENERLAPTGTITFLEDGVAVTTVPFAAANQNVTLPISSVGTHQFTAVYSGDDFFYGSTSTARPIALAADGEGGNENPPAVSGGTGEDTALDADTAVVMRLYRDVLHRPASADELNMWTGALDSGNATAGDVAAAFIGSAEYRTGLIQNLYQSVLGRGADDAGLNAWLGFFGAGNTLEQMQAQFYGSQEYFDTHGGTNSALIHNYYSTFLGRDAEAGGVAYWTAQLEQGTPRDAVAMGIRNTSTEGAQKVVRSVYEAYLRRDPDAAGLEAWTQELRGGASQLTLATQILGSQEYFNEV